MSEAGRRQQQDTTHAGVMWSQQEIAGDRNQLKRERIEVQRQAGCKRS